MFRRVLPVVFLAACMASPAFAQRRSTRQSPEGSRFLAFKQETGRVLIRDVYTVAAPTVTGGTLEADVIRLKDAVKGESHTALRLRFKPLAPRLPEGEVAPTTAKPEVPKNVMVYIDADEVITAHKSLEFMIKNQTKWVKQADTYREISLRTEEDAVIGFYIDAARKTLGAFIEIEKKSVPVASLEELRDLFKAAGEKAKEIGK